MDNNTKNDTSAAASSPVARPQCPTCNSEIRPAGSSFCQDKFHEPAAWVEQPTPQSSLEKTLCDCGKWTVKQDGKIMAACVSDQSASEVFNSLSTTVKIDAAPAAPVVEQREHEGRLIMQKDWVALLTEICKVYGILEPEWDDADIHAIAEEFDPWNALREIDKKLRAPAAGSAERWIPVSEKMPILYSSALIVHTETRDGKAIVEEAQYVGSDEYGQWCLVRTLRDDESIYLTEQVTHWRPLPSPPALAGTDTDVAKGE